MSFLLLFVLLQGPSSLASTPSSAVSRDTIPLTLPDAVARALVSGDETRAAAAQVDVADAQVTIARSAGLPQLRLNGSDTHVIQSARAQAVGSIFNQPYTYNANATLSQPLFQGGRVVAGMRAARDVKTSTRLDASEVGASTAVDVQRSYLQALFSRTLAEIQDTAFALAGQRLLLAQQLERAGRASQYDTLRAQVEQANLQPVVIQAHSNVDLALLDLKRLINVPFDQPVRLATTIDTATVLAWVSRLRADGTPPKRAAIRSAELVSEARHAGIGVARADLLPTISFNALIGAQAYPLSGFPTTRGRFVEIACPPGSAAGKVCTQQNGGFFGDKSLGFTISLPVFDGLRAKGGIDLASAQARLADLQLAQTRERVASEVASAAAELDRAQAAFAARGQTANEAEEAYRLAALRQSRGLATQLEVSDAQLALTTAKSNEARAIYDLYLAAVAYARSLGRPPALFPLPQQSPDGNFIQTGNRAH